jgi:hypothetical protein
MALQLSNPSVRINSDVETLFSNITDGRSTYYSSPLMDILKDLRLKHIVAAATTTGKHMSYIKEEEDTVGGGWRNVHLSNVCEIAQYSLWRCQFWKNGKCRTVK